MGLGKKLVTLINATIRGGLPQRRQHRVNQNDPTGQLETVRQALAAVELQERAVAEKLKETQANVEEALTQGNSEVVAAQRKLAQKLETQLQTQSTEAIALSEKLAAIEQALVETQAETEATIADAQDGLNPLTEPTATPDDVASGDSVAPSDDSELAARKSRLSG